MNKKIVLIVTLIISTLSCTKNIEDFNGSNGTLLKSNESIPYFSSVEDMIYELNQRMERSNEGVDALIDYENNKGYTSIGRLADEFYFKCIDTIQNDTLLLNTFKSYTDLITLNISDEDTFYLPKYSSIPQRYIANRDGLFQIGNMVTRIFEEGTVSTTVDNITSLKNMSPSDLVDLDTLRFFYSPVYKDGDNETSNIETEQNKGTHAQYLFDMEETMNWPSHCYMEFQGDDADHTLHNIYMKRSETSKSGKNKVEMNLSFSKQYYMIDLVHGGKYFLAYLDCKSYYKKWYGWILNPTTMRIKLNTLSCVEECGIKSYLNINVTGSKYERLLFIANVNGLYTNGKKYVHFRGSNSQLSSEEVTNPAYLVFGDLRYVLY
ncbi:MAG: hypothetical protein K5918_04540 [Bacteroidales bacterium]|nr:hypothetical protein [Bacteroidales bacterium]